MKFVLEKLVRLEVKTNLQNEKIKEQEKIITAQKSTIPDEQKIKLDSILGSSSHVFTDKCVWEINQFMKRMKLAKNHRYNNHPLEKCFYTSCGHKLNIKIFLNGNGKCLNKHVSIFFNTEVGTFDDAIQWPMRARINYCILVDGNEIHTFSIDTTAPKIAGSFQKPCPSNSDNEFGHIDFISLDDPVLKNNSMTFKIDVYYF